MNSVNGPSGPNCASEEGGVRGAMGALWDPLNACPPVRTYLWMALAILACLFQGPSFVDRLYPSRDHGVDFFQDWASGRNFLEGARIYESHEVTIERYLGFRPTRIDFPLNAHPPTSVLVAIPFAGLDYPAAVLAWNLLSLALFAFSLLAIARALAIPVCIWSLFPLLALALVCGPLRVQVVMGQFNLVLLLFFTCIWLADRNDRPFLAGMLLGVATAVKLFPGLFFLYFAAQRRWKTIVAGIVALGLVTVLTVSVLGTRCYVDYFNQVIPSVNQYRSYAPNISVWGFWYKLFDPNDGYLYNLAPLCESPLSARLGSLASSALIVASCVWVAWRSTSRLQRDQAFAITMIATLLVSPISWDHYLLLLTPALALTWSHLRPSNFDRVSFFVILLVFWAPPRMIWDRFLPLHGNATSVHALTLLSLQTYALLFLFAFSIAQWHRTLAQVAPVTDSSME
jgi:hypothetical protein